MAELLITEQYFDDVVVLHMRGKMSIGEGSVTVRSALRRLLDKGERKFVMNFAGVRYIDSSGNGEMIASYTTINKAGGRIVFCQLSQKIQDLWTIGKLLTVFDVYDDVGGALSALSVPHRSFECPVEGCKNRITLPYGPAGSSSVLCPACETRFEITLSPGDSSNSVDGVIGSFSIPTYQKEYIRTTLGSPTVIEINGRLDLFACDILRKAWQTIPPPRRVIFDISQATEISQRGLEVLHELCLSDEIDTAAVILTSSQPPDTFQTSISVYEQRGAAIAALAGPHNENFHPLMVDIFETGFETESQS